MVTCCLDNFSYGVPTPAEQVTARRTQAQARPAGETENSFPGEAAASAAERTARQEGGLTEMRFPSQARGTMPRAGRRGGSPTERGKPNARLLSAYGGPHNSESLAAGTIARE